MKTVDLSHKTIVISRTDSIGDVILTLPLCGWLKEQFPTVRILFLGKSYTVDVLRCSPYIDEIICLEDWKKLSFSKQIEEVKELNIDAFVHVFPNKHLAKLVKAAKVPLRIGTAHRLFHLWTCNVKPRFTRKNSNYHEAQLNFELLRHFGITTLPDKKELIQYLGDFKPQDKLPNTLQNLLTEENKGKRVILHTKSQGSAVEWPLEKYIELAEQLTQKGYTIFFSGTEKEGVKFRNELPYHPQIIDVSGKSTLGELITFIAACDVLVACSTGPLHLAAVLGKKAIGLYTDLRPMHPGRWAPIGEKSVALTANGIEKPELSDIYLIEVKRVLKVIED